MSGGLIKKVQNVYTPAAGNFQHAARIPAITDIRSTIIGWKDEAYQKSSIALRLRDIWRTGGNM